MNQLKTLEKEELLRLLLELASLNKDNADFLKLKLQNKPEEAITYYKQKIKTTLWQNKINFKEAKKAISDFKKICKEPKYLLELMVFYVENGEEISNTYGDMYEAFYNSIENMFDQIIKTLNEKPEFIPQFKERLNSMVKKSCEGWGHQDYLMSIYEELK